MDPLTAALNLAAQIIAMNLEIYKGAGAEAKAALSDAVTKQTTEMIDLVTKIFHAFHKES